RAERGAVDAVARDRLGVGIDERVPIDLVEADALGVGSPPVHAIAATEGAHTPAVGESLGGADGPKGRAVGVDHRDPLPERAAVRVERNPLAIGTPCGTGRPLDVRRAKRRELTAEEIDERETAAEGPATVLRVR